MREHGLQAPQRVGHPHGPKAHDGTIITERPDEMWGTDMTTTVTTEEGQVCVFVAVDHCTGECIGIHASKSGNRFEALEPLRQGVREHFGGFDRGIAAGLAIRHDHGSAYMSDDFQRELAFLGMTSSPSFVREPEGNGVAERFIRTLKENLLWVRHFATVAELVEALREFKRRYNEQWLIERHGFRTPAQARAESSRSRHPRGRTPTSPGESDNLLNVDDLRGLVDRCACSMDRRQDRHPSGPLSHDSLEPGRRRRRPARAGGPPKPWPTCAAAYWYPLYAFIRRKGYDPRLRRGPGPGPLRRTPGTSTRLRNIDPAARTFPLVPDGMLRQPPLPAPGARAGPEARRRSHGDPDRSPRTPRHGSVPSPFTI